MIKVMAKNPFVGHWRITNMDEWGPDYLDLVVPAFIRIEPGAAGSFQFGTVVGWLDYRVVTENERSRLEWSWQGFSDSDDTCGRGWAVLDGPVLKGHLFIHASDDSAFLAAPQSPDPARGPIHPRVSRTAPPRSRRPRATRPRRA
jgi:hypothetical protein